MFFRNRVEENPEKDDVYGERERPKGGWKAALMKKVCSVPRRWEAGERDMADRRGIE
jgi:hypothetical protein